MKKEYEIIPLESGKQAIIYYENGKEETREHYSEFVEIRQGYTEKKK